MQRSARSEVVAVAFDLDGVLVDTEPLWAAAKQQLSADTGGNWRPEAPVAMLGMSGPEWSAYMRDELGVPLDADEIARRVVADMVERVEAGVPVIPGAPEAVAALAARWRLALASSADRPVIEAALGSAGLAEFFPVIVSSGEAGRGKPAPDVYLAAARALGVDPAATVAVEDSPNGMRAAASAGMRLVAIPNAHAGIDESALALADVVLDGIRELTPAIVAAL